MMPDLVKMVRVELLDPLQQPDRMEVARARPHVEIARRHGLEIVVEDVGLGRDDRSRARRPCAGSRASASRSWWPGSARGSRGWSAKCSAPPSARSSRSTEVTTTCASPSLTVASATCSGSPASSAPGRPVLTLQKAQARVQVSPMIMKVACFLSQHSPMFGQPASSHTVTQTVLPDDVAGCRHSRACSARARGSSPASAATARVRPVHLFRVTGAQVACSRRCRRW